MEVANDPDSGAGDLKEVMEADAALSSRVLRCVNSSAYATRNDITNLQQAIAYLGIKQIRNLAMTASVSELFKKDEEIGAYNRAGLWRHLVAVGICARLIAMRLNLKDFEDVFLAGLLHDIGIILEDQHLHKHFVNVVGSLEEGKTLVEVETQQIGFDHLRLGASVAKTWKFPEGVMEAIRYHHDSAKCQSEHVMAVRCVEVANLVCSLKGFCSVGGNYVQFPRAAIEGLSLKKDDLKVLVQDLDREFDSQQKLFHV
jgi:putative nucleotidyltransferase with HDIG domain